MVQDRLAQAADILEIQAVLSRYAHAVDARDWDRLRSVFIDGATIDFTNNGGPKEEYPAIVEFLDTSLAGFAAYQHYMTNYDIELDGDTATCRNYVFTQMVTIVDGGEALLSDGGWYDSTFVRTDDGWRMSGYVAGLIWIDGEWPAGVPRPGWWGVSSDRWPAPLRSGLSHE